MRNVLIVLVVLLAALYGYAYYRNPEGCRKILSDVGGVANSGFDKLKTDAGPVLASLSPSATAPASPQVGADSSISISNAITGHLMTADGTPYTFPANAPASSLKFYAIYYSAQWCPPCHKFTPVLAEWYRRFKPAHPDFELIFVSDDHDKASWLAYMKEMAMPWPAFSFDDLQQNGHDIEKFAGSGIPDLVLVDAGGKVLADSFTPSGEYRGPDKVIADIEKMLGPGVAAVPAQASITAPPQPQVNPAPVAAAATAPTPNPAPSAPPASEFHPWTPPAVTPAQPDWIWTTTDGTIYQNVVVTKIGPDTVSITHSMGVAHDIPIANLPPDIQKKLNYDPVAAAAAHKEKRREEEHPYFTMAQVADAEALAAQMHWPLAWMESDASYLSQSNPAPGGEAEMTQQSVDRLKSRAIVIFADGNTDLGKLPPLVLAQMFVMDDGPLPDGHHFYAPKTVLTDAAATKALGRISYTQLKGGGAQAIDETFAAMPADAAPAPSTNAPPASSTAP